MVRVIADVRRQRMRLRDFGVMAAVLSAAHLMIALGSFAIAFSFGMEQFDAGAPIDGGRLEVTASVVAKILWQPMLPIWSAMFFGRSSPWLLQWFAFLLNSVLWGLALASLVVAIKTRLRAR
jgi:hypothetical protein